MSLGSVAAQSQSDVFVFSILLVEVRVNLEGIYPQRRSDRSTHY